MRDWQPIETIPDDRAVEVLTVTGLIRLAKASIYAVKRLPGQPLRRHCWRQDRSADLMAVKWREVT